MDYLTRKNEIKRTRKGNWFLKKSGSILCEGSQVDKYNFIQKNHEKYGLRWLLNRMKINVNAYYFYIKNITKKAKKAQEKQKIQSLIKQIYHTNHGTPGYRMMRDELIKHDFNLSPNTVYKYMKELEISSITRRKYHYNKGEAHVVFADLL